MSLATLMSLMSISSFGASFHQRTDQHLFSIWVCSCVFAAIETTLWSIEWGVAELVNNPEMQARISKELDDILGKGNLVTEPDTYNNKLPYLSAFVKEVMRLHMAIPLLVPHMNLHQAKLAGYDIPSESKILVNAWWIANNPKHWDEPEKFNPDRFLDGKIEASGDGLPVPAVRRGPTIVPGNHHRNALVIHRPRPAHTIFRAPSSSRCEESRCFRERWAVQSSHRYPLHSCRQTEGVKPPVSS